MKNTSRRHKQGFTLVEIVVAATIFLIVAFGVYGGYQALYSTLAVANQKVVAASLINERFEIARNLPYTDVGVTGSVPSGKLVANEILVRDGISFEVSINVDNVDDPFDGSAPADISPADYKLMEVTLECDTCKNFQPLKVVGRIAPRSLEP